MRKNLLVKLIALVFALTLTSSAFAIAPQTAGGEAAVTVAKKARKAKKAKKARKVRKAKKAKKAKKARKAKKAKKAKVAKPAG